MLVEEASISFKEAGKRHEHEWQWKYDDIQQLTLSETELRILTYEDRKWQLGRDREYAFDQLPKDLAANVYSLLRDRLDQRFVVHLSVADVKPLWQVDAKLLQRFGGSQGRLVIGEDRIEYRTDGARSYTWRLRDIDNVSTAGPFDLSITTSERSGWLRGSLSVYHFQLKQALTEDRYNRLWRSLNDSLILSLLQKGTNPAIYP
jgi:hypothetical protein